MEMRKKLMDEKNKIARDKNRILKKSELVKIVKFFYYSIFYLSQLVLDAIFPKLKFCYEYI